MRLLLEIIIAAALIALAWEKSWKERASDLPWLGDKLTTIQDHPRSYTSNPRPTATVSGAWMWDPNRQSILDTPKPKPVTTVPVPSSTAGSWLFDPNHRSSLDPPSQKHPAPTPP